MSQDKQSDRPASAAIASRQVLRFNSFAEVAELARGLYQANCTPKNVDRPEKLIPMLLAGAELGLGVMASLKYITPPVNGICSLWGDAGLALVRASGQLKEFDEKIEGDGDERKAVCTIQRAGYPVKSFEYPLKLAKALHSYKKHHEINPKTREPIGGPWHDDPDNMLEKRARWRALRSEFTDILNGMGGAEEQDEDVITVEATPSPPVAGAITAGTTPAATTTAAAAIEAAPLATKEQFDEIVRLFKLMQTHAADGTDPAGVWAELLRPFNVDSATKLTPESADKFIAVAGKQLDSFTYPSTTPVAT